MTETNQPSGQPPQPEPVPQPMPQPMPQPGYPNSPYGNPQYGNQQYGSPQYGNPQYGNAQYGNAPYGSYPQYGTYNNAPYGYPQGYYGQPPGTSGLAIASLVLGICGFLCVTPFVGLPLGLAALSKIKRTGQPGKGMAIAGIVLSSLWILLMILLLATGNFHFNVGNGSGPDPSIGPTQGPDGTSA
jgi:hypothetical protein